MAVLIAPTEILMYMLGNAARAYSRMRVAEASQWDIVKAALVAEYAMPRLEAWRRFTTCRLEDGDTIDVFYGLSGKVWWQGWYVQPGFEL